MMVLGIDVSEYQTGLRLSDAKAAGARFVIARCTRGPGLYRDPTYHGFKHQAREQLLDFAAYHFLGEDPQREAPLMLAAEPRQAVPWMLDLEPAQKYGTRPTYADALTVRELLTEAGHRATLLYLPHWYWDQIGRPSLVADGWGGLVQSRYPLAYTHGPLAALYDRIDTADQAAGWASMGGAKPLLWQYTSSVDVPGYKTNTVDGNAYRGTMTALRARKVLRTWSASDTVDDMATSQNGWPVLFENRTTGPLPRLRKWIIPGAARHIYLRDGSVGFVLIHMALWWHERFNPLSGGVWDEWGWAVRPVRGQTSGYSNHASGTAEDLDATEYPRGIPVLSRINAVNVARIRARLLLYRTTTGHAVIQWGGDYHGTPDGMHLEINEDTPMGQVEEVARRLLNTPRGRKILDANPGAREVILS